MNIQVQPLPPEGSQIFEIERNFYYVRDLVEKCAQHLKKQNVQLYYDKDCQWEIESDRKIEEAGINQIIYAKIIENQFEQSSQYGDVICWFIRDGIELPQGVQLRSDFTFEEVLDDAIYQQKIIDKMPQKIKVTNYQQTQVLATLMEMQMFKLIGPNEKEPQLTIHFTSDGKEPIVENIQFKSQFQKFPVFPGLRKEFQPNMAQRNQNFQPQFPNQQQQPFQQLNNTNFSPPLNVTQQNKPQIFNANFQPQSNFPQQQKPQNNIQQSQQILQSNIIGQSTSIPQIQNNKQFQINQQNSSINKAQFPQIGLPTTFNPTVPPEKSPIQSLQKNQNNAFIPPYKNPVLGLPNQNNQTNQQQQLQFQNSYQQQHDPEANRILEQMAQKTVDQLLLLGNFTFLIDQNGEFVKYTHQTLTITGYFLEIKGKEISLKNENHLKWQTRYGVSIALNDNLGFVIKWKNNTCNSILMNYL